MFRNCRQRHPVRSRQIGNASVTAGQMREDAPPGRVREGGKRSVQCPWWIFNHPVKHLAEMYRDANAKICVPAPGSEPPDLQPSAVAPALLRVRALFRCKPLFGRSVLRIRVRRRSLGNPSGFHRRRELRTTLWCQIEFSLHFFGSTWSLNRSRSHSGLWC